MIIKSPNEDVKNVHVFYLEEKNENSCCRRVVLQHFLIVDKLRQSDKLDSSLEAIKFPSQQLCKKSLRLITGENENDEVKRLAFGWR
jgi:hypothetical protein